MLYFFRILYEIRFKIIHNKSDFKIKTYMVKTITNLFL